MRSAAENYRIKDSRLDRRDLSGIVLVLQLLESDRFRPEHAFYILGDAFDR